MMGCPISIGRSYLLPFYLDHLYQQEYPRKHIHIAFLFNYPKKDTDIAVPQGALHQQAMPRDQEVEKIRSILENFKKKKENEYRKITIHEYEGNYEDRNIQGRRAQGRWMDYFAEIRNKFIDLRDEEDDYVFSVDSDVFISKESLKQLVSHNLDIVSLLIANGPIHDPYISPNRLENFLLPYIICTARHQTFIDRVHLTGSMAFNVMMKYMEGGNGLNKYDEWNYKHIDPAELHVRELLNYDPQIYNDNLKCRLDIGPELIPQRYGPLAEVDMTGAAYLIKREVLDAGVRYGFHHQGEDCYFSAMAQEKGFHLYCDIYLRGNHIMNESIFNSYQAGKRYRVIGMKPSRDIDKGKVEEGMKSTLPVILEKVKSY